MDMISEELGLNGLLTKLRFLQCDITKESHEHCPSYHSDDRPNVGTLVHLGIALLESSNLYPDVQKPGDEITRSHELVGRITLDNKITGSRL